MRIPETALVSVHITAPSRELAERLARRLVEGGHVACVNLLPGARSIYKWKGVVEETAECLLLAKTRASRLEDVERVVLEEHSDDVPCVLALPITSGHGAYLDWLTEQVAPR